MYKNVCLVLSVCVVVRTQVIPGKSRTNDGDFNFVNTDGSFDFGYANKDNGQSYHLAHSNAQGVVGGRFGAKDPATNTVKETVYSAGPRGFRAKGPNVHRKMDLDQRPRGPIGNKDDPYFDPNEDPSYSFKFDTRTYSKNEDANARGDVKGHYSFVDDVGERHEVSYIAGKDTGFHVSSAHPDSPNVIGSPFHRAPLVRGESKPRGRTAVQRGLDGSYRFISAGPDQRRTESSDSHGNVRGSYTFLDDKGVQRTVHYIAGPGIGYRIVKGGKDPYIPSYFPTIPSKYDPDFINAGSTAFVPAPEIDSGNDDVFKRPEATAASGHVKPPPFPDKERPGKKPTPPTISSEDDSDEGYNQVPDYPGEGGSSYESESASPGFGSGSPPYSPSGSVGPPFAPDSDSAGPPYVSASSKPPFSPPSSSPDNSIFGSGSGSSSGGPPYGTGPGSSTYGKGPGSFRPEPSSGSYGGGSSSSGSGLPGSSGSSRPPFGSGSSRPTGSGGSNYASGSNRPTGSGGASYGSGSNRPTGSGGPSFGSGSSRPTGSGGASYGSGSNRPTGAGGPSYGSGSSRPTDSGGLNFGSGSSRPSGSGGPSFGSSGSSGSSYGPGPVGPDDSSFVEEDVSNFGAVKPTKGPGSPGRRPTSKPFRPTKKPYVPLKPYQTTPRPSSSEDEYEADSADKNTPQVAIGFDYEKKPGITTIYQPGTTIIRNIGQDFFGVPPGVSVRAHVQSIDLYPYDSKPMSPSEAIEKDQT